MNESIKVVNDLNNIDDKSNCFDYVLKEICNVLKTKKCTWCSFIRIKLMNQITKNY